MVCEHLKLLEQELLDREHKPVFRGVAWSKGSREWVYFNLVLDLQSLAERFEFPDCVVQHEHIGTHDGREAGFVCTTCDDAIMGVHPKYAEGKASYL